MSTVGIATDTFGLTLYSGDQFRSAAQLARDANLTGLVDGHGMIYTSEGHNLAGRLLSERLAAHLAREVASSYDALPSIVGSDLVLPPCRITLDGENFALHGPAVGGGQAFSLTGLSAGNYALIIESWVAMTGVSTYGRATLPSFSDGVLSAQNKPSASALYRAGNLDAVEAVDELPLITGTLETQRGLQRQYALRLSADRDLNGQLCVHAPAIDRAGTIFAGTGAVLTATSAQSETAYDVAIDRTYQTAKLAIVTVLPSGVAELHLNAPHLGRVASALGQPPLPVVLPKAEHQARMATEITRIDAADLAAQARITRLESLTQHAVYLTEVQPVLAATDQLVFFGAAETDLGWHGPAQPQRFTLDFSGSLALTAHFNFDPSGLGNLDGVRGAGVWLNGADIGVRVTQLASGAAASGIQLAAELDVKAGDFIELIAFHTSGNPTLSLRSGRLSLRRVN